MPISNFIPILEAEAEGLDDKENLGQEFRQPDLKPCLHTSVFPGKKVRSWILLP